MPYSKLLKKAIAETNYTNVEIITKCEEIGTHINETYFSKILSGKNRPPSDKKSRAIAKVIGIDERKLVIEGYLDKAPKEIKNAFQNILLMENLSAIKYIELFDKTKLNELQNYFDEQPLNDMIIEILDNTQNYIQYLENEFYIEKMDNGKEIKLGLANPVGIEVTDDAMSPRINKGNKITFEFIGDTYKSTDILVVKTKQNPEVRLRNVIKINNTIKLQGYDEKYTEMCDKQDLIILGKVNNVIKKI